MGTWERLWLTGSQQSRCHLFTQSTDRLWGPLNIAWIVGFVDVPRLLERFPGQHGFARGVAESTDGTGGEGLLKTAEIVDFYFHLIADNAETGAGIDGNVVGSQEIL